MNWQDQLISIYISACDFFLQIEATKILRCGPNSSPSFTDSEALTIYIFGILKKQRTVKSIHRYFKDHLLNWFPDLPNYEGFLARINNIHELFPEFAIHVLQNPAFLDTGLNPENLAVVDSLPIVMAKGYRSHKCKTAKDFAEQGYCASKKLYYYGVKIHFLGEYREKTLPSPKILKVTKANVHDFTAMKEHFFEFKGSTILGDKAYCDQKTKENLNEKGIKLYTPIKLSRSKKELDENEKLFSKIVSSFRQSVEIAFNWLIESTGIQTASKVRSKQGLFVHVFGRISAALFSYIFNNGNNIVNS